MPKLQRRALARNDWTDGDRHMVEVGNDFWGEARWPCWMNASLEVRAAWQPADTFASMAECWADCRLDILAAQTDLRKPCWGQLVFDQGMSPTEADEFLSEPPPPPTEWQIKNGYCT